MDALVKGGHVLELRLAGNDGRQWASQPAGGRGTRDSQFREQSRVSGPADVFADPVVVGPTRRLMELHPPSFRREVAGLKQRPWIQEMPARSGMLQMHTPSSQRSSSGAPMLLLLFVYALDVISVSNRVNLNQLATTVP